MTTHEWLCYPNGIVQKIEKKNTYSLVNNEGFAHCLPPQGCSVDKEYYLEAIHQKHTELWKKNHGF